MVNVRILRGDEYKYISLLELCEKYYKAAPEGWFMLIEDEIEGAMNIKTKAEYDEFIEKHKHLGMRGKFDNKELKRFYEVLKKLKYNTMFDDDILKFISYIRQLSFFDIIDYKLDGNNPDLDEWFNSKNPFKYGYKEEELKNAYSMMDLLPLKYGMNAIRGQLLKANKKIW
jgi:hypothetical protein